MMTKNSIILLTITFLCLAAPAIAQGTMKRRSCVTVQHEEVATCRFAKSFGTRVRKLSAQTAHVEKKVDKLRKDVDELQENASLYRIFANFNSSDRRFCEIYTMSEAEEICKLATGFEIPDPFFVHIPCGDIEECPETFWRIKPGCFRPNKGPLGLFDCFVDPVYETCDRPVFLTCEGYTQTFAEGWLKF